MFEALFVIFIYLEVWDKLVMLMRKIPPSFINYPTLSFEKTQALEKPISNATAKSSNFSTNWLSKSSVLCVRQVCRENGEQLESGKGFIPWWRLLTAQAHWAHSCWGGHKKNQNQFVKYLHQNFFELPHTHNSTITTEFWQEKGRVTWYSTTELYFFLKHKDF